MAGSPPYDDYYTYSSASSTYSSLSSSAFLLPYYSTFYEHSSTQASTHADPSSANLYYPVNETQLPLAESLKTTVNDDLQLELPDNYGDPAICSMRPELFWSLVYGIAYSIVFVVGLIGNLAVIVVIHKTATMRRNIVHILLANLAVADLMVILICLPATLLGHLTGTWELGLYACKAVAYLQGVAVSASINTLVAVSIDRYLAICFPLKVQMSCSRARHLIAAIWLFSLLITSPWLLVFTLIPLESDTCPRAFLCYEIWPNETLERVYFIIGILCLYYLIPLAIIIVTCTAIFAKVWRRQMPGEVTSQQAQMEQLMQRSKLKVVKMMLVVIVFFILSWLPLYAIFTRFKLGGQIESDSLEERILLTSVPIAKWLGISNSAVNPIIYSLNKNYRKNFIALMKKWNCCPRLLARYSPGGGRAREMGSEWGGGGETTQIPMRSIKREGAGGSGRPGGRGRCHDGREGGTISTNTTTMSSRGGTLTSTHHHVTTIHNNRESNHHKTVVINYHVTPPVTGHVIQNMTPSTGLEFDDEEDLSSGNYNKDLEEGKSLLAGVDQNGSKPTSFKENNIGITPFAFSPSLSSLSMIDQHATTTPPHDNPALNNNFCETNSPTLVTPASNTSNALPNASVGQPTPTSETGQHTG